MTRPDLRRYGGLLALGLWAALALWAQSKAPFGLDEGGAKALILDWSIGDQVANSVVTLGAPDVRAMIWLPLGYLFSGNLFAAKVLSTLGLAWVARELYRWRTQRDSGEAALLGTALFLMAPVTLQQLDALAPGPWVVAFFLLGWALDRAYCAQPSLFGGLFFAQIVACAASVTLHPVGLAYPVALFWQWLRKPLDAQRAWHFKVGIGVATLLGLALAWGWPELHEWHNPFTQLPQLLWGADPFSTPGVLSWGAGMGLTALWAVLMGRRRRLLQSDLAGSSLWLGALLGLVFCDATWVLLVGLVLFQEGFSWLLRPRSWAPNAGFLSQRGAVLALFMLLSVLNLHADRLHWERNRDWALSAQDVLIKTYADDVDRLRRTLDELRQPMPRLRVASQWPARTMLACRCDALPLPPTARSPMEQRALLRGVTHLMLLPNDSANLGLSQNLSLLGPELETISLQPGGVVLRVVSPQLAPLPAAAPGAASGISPQTPPGIFPQAAPAVAALPGNSAPVPAPSAK